MTSHALDSVACPWRPCSAEVLLNVLASHEEKRGPALILKSRAVFSTDEDSFLLKWLELLDPLICSLTAALPVLWLELTESCANSSGWTAYCLLGFIA